MFEGLFEAICAVAGVCAELQSLRLFHVFLDFLEHSLVELILGWL